MGHNNIHTSLPGRSIRSLDTHHCITLCAVGPFLSDLPSSGDLEQDIAVLQKVKGKCTGAPGRGGGEAGSAVPDTGELRAGGRVAWDGVDTGMRNIRHEGHVTWCMTDIISSISKLQCLQNAVVMLLTSTIRFDHITPVLNSIYWLPVEKRINFKVLLLV